MTEYKGLRNKFADKCYHCKVDVPVGKGWLRKAALRNGYVCFCEEHKLMAELEKAEPKKLKVKTGSKLIGSKVRRPANRGVTLKLGVRDSWVHIFTENHSVGEAFNNHGTDKKPMTDQQISEFMHSEFPKASESAYNLKRVRMYRGTFNKNTHSFAKLPEPTFESIEYGDDGKPVEGKKRKSRINSKPTGLTEEQIRKIAREEAEKTTRRIEIKLPKVKESIKIDCAHQCLESVVKRVAAGIPVLLVGPTGSGKTVLAKQVAKALSMDFTFNSMSEGVSESHLLGRVTPAKNGEWKYSASPFVKSFKSGGVHLFDEIDAADPNLLVVVNSAIANGLLSLPFAQAKPINQHNDYRTIAAANTYGNGADREYVGRNQLDAATLNRFTMGTIEVDYDRVLEKTLVDGLLEKDLLLAGRLTAWCWSTRTSIRSAKLRRTMSTRNIIDSAKLLNAGLSLEDIQKSFFLGWSDDEKRKVQR